MTLKKPSYQHFWEVPESIIWFYRRKKISFVPRCHSSSLDCLSTNLCMTRWIFIHYVQFSSPKEINELPLTSTLFSPDSLRWIYHYTFPISSCYVLIRGIGTARTWQASCHASLRDTKALDEHVTNWRSHVGLDLEAASPVVQAGALTT